MGADQETASGGTSPATALLVSGIAAAVALSCAWAVDGGWRPRGLLICAALALGVQWLAFLPAWWARTEHYYDLTGSGTYLAVVGLGLYWSPATPRSWLLAALVAIWAGRLGSFLFLRVRRAGSDSRFVALMRSPAHFFMTWTLQGLWVFLTLLAALTAMLTATGPATWTTWDAVGVLVWLTGFALEVVADRQKQRFRATRGAGGRPFIDSGLWAWSRHPNYFGEIVLWCGIALICAQTFSGRQWLALVSPLFVFVLLRYVSGIPMLEEAADRRWGGEPEYQRYKANTPLLLLRPPQRR